MPLSRLSARAVGVAFCLALAAGAVQTHAATLSATSAGSVSGTPTVAVTFFNTRLGTTGGYQNMTTYAGRNQWAQVSVSSDAPFARPANGFTTFCIEYTQSIVFGDKPTYVIDDLAVAPKPYGSASGNPASGMGAENGLGTTRAKDVLIRQLWAQFYSTLAGTIDAAAFQLAIWKTIYEDSTTTGAFTNIAVGNFQVTSSSAVTGKSAGQTFSEIASKATTYLTWLTDDANATARQQGGLYALTNDAATGRYQDQVYWDGSNTTFITTEAGGLPGVPLPGAALGGGVALAGLTLRRARRA